MADGGETRSEIDFVRLTREGLKPSCKAGAFHAI